LKSIVNPLGEAIAYTYDDDLNRTSITDRNGNITQFAYDEQGNVVATRDPDNPSNANDGGITSVEYNNASFPNLPTRKFDALGRDTVWEYDANGNCTKEIDPNGFETNWTYNGFGQKETENNKNSNTTTYVYDGIGRLTEVNDAESNHIWFDYDELWRLTKVTDGRGSGVGDPCHTTTTVYDNADRVTSVSGPITSQSYEYDSVGNRIKTINGKGNFTTYEYDNNKNLTKTTGDIPGEPNQVTQYSHDSLNRKTSMTNPNNNVTQYEYDLAGRMVKKINPEADEATYTYDPHGNVLTVTDGSGVTIAYEYDSLHRKISQSDELGNSWNWEYDKLGNLTKSTDAESNITQYEYDPLSRLVSVTDSAAKKMEYEYDNVGNLTQIKDGGGRIITKKFYDAANRLIRKEDGLTNAYIYDYDGAGNLTSVTDPDTNIKTMVYDNENRLDEINYPDASQVIYSYDNNGNLISMTDSTGTSTYSYDPLDRLISSNDGFGKQVDYEYDSVGNRIGITYPADSTNPARTVNYSYDKANRLDKITDWSAREWDYTTDGVGKITQLNYPNGIKKQQSFDDAGRLASLVYKNSADAKLMSYYYTRDAQGNPIRIDSNGVLEPNISLMFRTDYSYDADNRLVSTSAPASYTYDNRGNVASKTEGGTTSDFAYNYENRLVSQTTGGSAVQHTYDGRENRIARSDNGSITRYILDHGRDMSHILCETDSAGEITAYYIHGPEIVGRIGADNSQRLYHTNHIGSVVALSDETETITDKYAYMPFGIPAGKSGSTVNPFTYIGGLGVMAEDDGLYVMRARFYEPETGRFYGKDPVEGSLMQPMSLYRYSYGNHNPVVYVDSTGNISEILEAGLYGGAKFAAASSAIYEEKWGKAAWGTFKLGVDTAKEVASFAKSFGSSAASTAHLAAKGLNHAIVFYSLGESAAAFVDGTIDTMNYKYERPETVSHTGGAYYLGGWLGVSLVYGIEAVEWAYDYTIGYDWGKNSPYIEQTDHMAYNGKIKNK